MEWQVSFLQKPDGSPNETPYEKFPVIDGVVKLGPGPFVIEVHLPEPIAVKLNVLGDDRNFLRITPGLSTGDAPAEEAHCFSRGTGLPEPVYHGILLTENGEMRVSPNRPSALVLDDTSHHELLYISDHEHRWSAINWAPDGPYFYREVDTICNNLGHYEPFNGHDLYLTFLVKCAEGDIIQPEELQKIQVQF